MSDLIAAVATARGAAAIGILRLSGPGAAEAAARVFRPASGRPLTSYPDRTLVYGVLRDQEGQVIDRPLATVSRAPHSYTGEDTAELQCHGSPAVLTMALEALYAQGVQLTGHVQLFRQVHAAAGGLLAVPECSVKNFDSFHGKFLLICGFFCFRQPRATKKAFVSQNKRRKLTSAVPLLLI